MKNFFLPHIIPWLVNMETWGVLNDESLRKKSQGEGKVTFCLETIKRKCVETEEYSSLIHFGACFGKFCLYQKSPGFYIEISWDVFLSGNRINRLYLLETPKSRSQNKFRSKRGLLGDSASKSRDGQAEPQITIQVWQFIQSHEAALHGGG